MNPVNSYFSFSFLVIWKPPYSNSEKRQPCHTLTEAERMMEWFESIHVPARIVRVMVKELEWPQE